MKLTKAEQKIYSKIQSMRGKLSTKTGMSMSERGKLGVRAKIDKNKKKLSSPVIPL